MKLPLVFLLVSLLTGCSVSEYYQLYSVQTPEGDNLEFVTDSVIISYNLWGESGKMEFSIYNRSDSTVYLNLRESFFLVNGLAYDYFSNSSITTQRSAAYTSTYQYYYYGVNSSSVGEGASQAITYYEKDVLIIPAHSYKVVNRFQLNGSYYPVCDLRKNPRYGKPDSAIFSPTNSPLKYMNVINLKVGGAAVYKEYTHPLYVSRIDNIHPGDFRVLYYRTVCGKTTDESYFHYPFAKKNRFYVRYPFQY